MNSKKIILTLAFWFVTANSFGVPTKTVADNRVYSTSMNLPAEKDIIAVHILHCYGAEISEPEAKLLFDGAAVVKSPEVWIGWHYAPWCNIDFYTKKGDFQVQLYLGGLGHVTKGKEESVVMFKIENITKSSTR